MVAAPESVFLERYCARVGSMHGTKVPRSDLRWSDGVSRHVMTLMFGVGALTND